MNSARELIQEEVEKKKELIAVGNLTADLFRKILFKQTMILISVALATLIITIVTVLYANRAGVKIYETIMVERRGLQNDREALRQDVDRLRKLKDSIAVERYLLEAIKEK